MKKLMLIGAITAATCQAETNYRGLWVGQVELNRVNEATVSYDAHNHAVASDPATPTPTSDAAQLRLIVHVDALGKACLLKDVAILRRSADGATRPGDLALISDERLYPDFPRQEAVRIASAVFDFGDYQATAAVDAVVEAVADAVGASVAGSGISASSSNSDLRGAEQRAQDAAALQVADAHILEDADVAAQFSAFMESVFADSNLQAMIEQNTPPGITAAAQRLADSFYADPRGNDLIAAVEANTNKAEQIAWRYADVGNQYLRTITGNEFSAMVFDSSQTAAAAVTNSLVSKASVSNAVYELASVAEIRTDALEWKISNEGDDAILSALDTVLAAVLETATGLTNSGATVDQIQDQIEAAAWAQQAQLPRYSVPLSVPTADYTAFVQSDAFLTCAAEAAEAAAVAAVSEKRTDPFSTLPMLKNTAILAARSALQSVYAEAAGVRRTELPMVGVFGPGNGSTNLALAADTPGGLKCTINLPASHPTNPFRHPKHPDHTRGIDLVRNIRLDFSGAAGDAPFHTPAGAVRLFGVYREEIFGLHKALGQNSDIGLKVEGSFELNRISLIDTLNAK